jgi:hypothetical protein
MGATADSARFTGANTLVLKHALGLLLQIYIHKFFPICLYWKDTIGYFFPHWFINWFNNIEYNWSIALITSPLKHEHYIIILYNKESYILFIGI